ncbi:MAG: branched-chain amino acid ABC transporter permease [Rhodospirillales bacterium]|nr:branched-chain amino acid ABC transporter permease [Rhodospirillales bacterium]
MIASLLLIGVVNGTMLGLVFALMAAGFNIGLGIARVINLYHGAMVVWSMYAVYLAWDLFGLSPVVSAIPTAVLAFGIGYVLQRYLVVRSLQAPEDNQILFALGLLTAFQFLAQFVFTDDAYSVRDELLQGVLIIGTQVFQVSMLSSALLALVMLTCLHFLFSYTGLGRNLRACAQNTTGAHLSGLDVPHLYAVAMGISAACAAVSGAAMALFVSIYPGRAFEYTLLSVVVSVVGGLGSLMGSMLGGLIIGLVLTVCQVLGYGGVAQGVVYSFVFVIFLVRPAGMLGGRVN